MASRGPLWAADASAPQPLPFHKAIELALQHSGVMGIATINQWRAEQGLSAKLSAQLHSANHHWLRPGLFVRLSLTLEGSAPSVANFTSVQSLFNPSLQQFIKAAKIDWKATSLDVQDKRNAVILDAALTYAQLEQLTGKLKTLGEAQSCGRQGAVHHPTAFAAGRGQQA